jgi:hypothetical protein
MRCAADAYARSEQHNLTLSSSMIARAPPAPSLPLCSPGLVFPAVDMPRALQVLCGIFPISQLREPYSSVQYLASRIEIERIYSLVPPTVAGILSNAGIDASGASNASTQGSSSSASGVQKFTKGGKRGVTAGQHSQADEDAIDRMDVFAELQIAEATLKAKEYVWSAWDICEAYAKMRNYSIKGSKGLYDTQRAANDILHDALSGVVLLTFAPPKRNTPLGAPSAATPVEQALQAAVALRAETPAEAAAAAGESEEDESESEEEADE